MESLVDASHLPRAVPVGRSLVLISRKESAPEVQDVDMNILDLVVPQCVPHRHVDVQRLRHLGVPLGGLHSKILTNLACISGWQKLQVW